MNVRCLMPTYGRTVALLNNALACFLWQRYDRKRLRLTVFDDEGYLRPQRSPDGWEVVTRSTRSPNLGAKYNEMVAADGGWADVFCVWDDDDLYLPGHVEQAVEAFSRFADPRPMWAHPINVWSTYTGSPRTEPAAGRFHGSLVVTRRAASWIATRRADFDQQMIGALQREHGEPARPDVYGLPTYVFRWGDTASTHCQAFMRSGDDETWYDVYAAEVAKRRAANREKRPDLLSPEFDDSAIETCSKLLELGVKL